jgi:hypothetical protein
MTPSKKTLLDRHTLRSQDHIGERTVRGHPYACLMGTHIFEFIWRSKGKHLGDRFDFSLYSFHMLILTSLA